MIDTKKWEWYNTNAKGALCAMIDLNLVLKDKEGLKRALAKKNYETAAVDKQETLLLSGRQMRSALDVLRQKRNAW